MKKCSRCGLEKEKVDFFKNKSTKDGLSYWCQACFRTYTCSDEAKAKAKAYKHSEAYLKKSRTYRRSGRYAAWYAAFKKTDKYRKHCRTVSPARRARRKTAEYRLRAMQSHWRRVYGISEQERLHMLRTQGNVCAACGNAFKDGKDTTVDHDHITGRVRGILCRGCNLALGLLKDSPARVHKLEVYIRGGGYNYERKVTDK